MYKNRQHPTEAECRLFCCPILPSSCRFCSFLKLLSYRHTGNRRAVQGRLKNHADPCDHGAEGDIEQEVQDVRPFIVAEHMRPYDALQLGIKMREEV